jgi:TRAP-type transport system periplasmic protein
MRWNEQKEPVARSQENTEHATCEGGSLRARLCLFDSDRRPDYRLMAVSLLRRGKTQTKGRYQNMKRVIYLAFVCLLAVSLCTLVHAQQHRFRVAYQDPPRLIVGDEKLIHPCVAAVYGFDDAINNLTGGSFNVDLKHSGVLGGAVENIDQTMSGVIEGSTPALPMFASYYPNIQVFSIPYLFENPLVAWEVLDGEFGQALFDDMAKKKGLRVIAVHDLGGYRNFSNNKREVKTAADMKGLKIRTMENPAEMQIVSSLGASPTPVPWAELYTSLQTGVVDGQENSPATIVVGSIADVQKYLTIDQHTLSLAVIVVGEKWFQGLPKNVQKSVVLAGKIAAVCGRGASSTNHKLCLEAIRKKGTKIYFPTTAERVTFKNAAQPTVIDWARKNNKIEGKWIDQLLQAVDKAERKLALK